jgi:hypothetical protein
MVSGYDRGIPDLEHHGLGNVGARKSLRKGDHVSMCLGSFLWPEQRKVFGMKNVYRL